MSDPAGFIFNPDATRRVQRAVKIVEGSGSFGGGGSLGGGGNQVILASLTGADTTDPRRHDWVQVRPNSNSAEVIPCGLSGTHTNLAAIEITAPGSNTALLVRGNYNDAGTIKDCWWILALPRGQYQFQIYSVVSQNQMGFDFVRAHSIL
jgi:hypothetical protein